MAKQRLKILPPANHKVQETHHYDLSVMKPFVKFGVAALGILAGALITIVKSVPKHEPEKKSNDKRVIKI